MLNRLSLCCFLLLISSFAIAQKAPYKRSYRKVDTVEYGMASYYAKKFQGRKTANGEHYDYNKMTAAHNHLPLGTWIRVTNTRNGREVVVKVNDRLHHRNKRLIDLSYAAAAKLKYVSRGLTRVKVEVLGKKRPKEAIVEKDGRDKKVIDEKSISAQ